ncbi:chaplin [Streptomyces sp. 2231.1]|uniref:chaplin n=1 Tax=Streptomyces sp. 2231.1 TaxID=1855347 RepID=UPI000B861B78
MRRATRNRVIALAAASGAMAVALPASAAFAADGSNADATAAGSPGLASGNSLQVPVSVPVNVCGNTADVVGLLNPAAGNTCTNTGGAHADGAGSLSGSASSDDAGSGSGSASSSKGASAHGRVTDSPGVLSGNGLQLPIDLPVNVSGNSINAVGVGNPVFGNQSVNGDDRPSVPRHIPSSKPRATKPPTLTRSHPVPHPHWASPTLAHTGTDLTTPAIAGSAALLLTGGLLYRRCRPGRSF